MNRRERSLYVIRRYDLVLGENKKSKSANTLVILGYERYEGTETGGKKERRRDQKSSSAPRTNLAGLSGSRSKFGGEGCAPRLKARWNLWKAWKELLRTENRAWTLQDQVYSDQCTVVRPNVILLCRLKGFLSRNPGSHVLSSQK